MSEKHIFKAISPDTFEVVEFEIEVPDKEELEKIFAQPLQDTAKNKIFESLKIIFAFFFSIAQNAIKKIKYFLMKYEEEKQQEQVRLEQEKQKRELEQKADEHQRQWLEECERRRQEENRQAILNVEAEYQKVVADYNNWIKTYCLKYAFSNRVEYKRYTWERACAAYVRVIGAHKDLAVVIGVKSICSPGMPILPKPPIEMFNEYIEKQQARLEEEKKVAEEQKKQAEKQKQEGDIQLAKLAEDQKDIQKRQEALAETQRKFDEETIKLTQDRKEQEEIERKKIELKQESKQKKTIDKQGEDHFWDKFEEELDDDPYISETEESDEETIKLTQEEELDDEFPYISETEESDEGTKEYDEGFWDGFLDRLWNWDYAPEDRYKYRLTNKCKSCYWTNESDDRVWCGYNSNSPDEIAPFYPATVSHCYYFNKRFSWGYNCGWNTAQLYRKYFELGQMMTLVERDVSKHPDWWFKCKAYIEPKLPDHLKRKAFSLGYYDPNLKIG